MSGEGGLESALKTFPPRFGDLQPACILFLPGDTAINSSLLQFPKGVNRFYFRGEQEQGRIHNTKEKIDRIGRPF